MKTRVYDEDAIIGRLEREDRVRKTAFAASCAQRLLPLYELYARKFEPFDDYARLKEAVSAAWTLAAGGHVDAARYQNEAESMVPSDEGPFSKEVAFAQNAAAAGAYALRTWLSDSPQEAAWAARQVYEFADYETLRENPGLDVSAPGAAVQIMSSPLVQDALDALDRSLRDVQSHPGSWEPLRAAAAADGARWRTRITD